MIRIVSKATCGPTIFALALTGCAGTATSSRVLPASATSDAQAAFVVHWPSAERDASVRRRNTLSSSTMSITVSVNGGAPRVVNKPTLSGSPTTTSVSIDAPVGTDSFTFEAWDQPGGIGNVLDQATVSQSIVANANNTLSVALDAVCAGLVPSVATASTYGTAHTGSITLASGSTQTVLSSLRMVGPFPAVINVNEIDADGNTLLASNTPDPIVLTESGPTQHVTIVPASTTVGNTKFTLTPTTAQPDASPTTITATSASCGTGSAFFPNSFTLSTSAIVYVSDSVAGIIAFDQDGTQVAKISSVAGITGLAYNSKTASLVAIESKSSTSGGITFQTLSLTGSSIGSGSISTTTANPVGNIAYNPVNGNFLVALRYYESGSTTYYGSVHEYTISGSTATAVTPAATYPFQQGSTTPPPYDPDCFLILPNGSVVVGDSMTSSYLFDQNGNYLNEAVGVAQNTLAFDSLRGNILEFDNTYSGQAYKASTFADIGAFAYPSDVTYNAAAYNQGEDELYGFSPNFAFGIPGSDIAMFPNASQPLSNLPGTAFAGLTSPTEAFVLP